MVCQGLACFVARHLNKQRWAIAKSQMPRVYCLGKCYAAPSAGDEDGKPIVGIDSPEPVVLGNVLDGGAAGIDAYLQRGGYDALKQALDRKPEEVIETVEASELRGRGGAGFPTGRKWRATYRQPAAEKYVVVNADEGDPGAYIDRFIMEDDPHKLIEATVIAGYAIGAKAGYIYLRAEYPKAYVTLQRAMEEARRRGFLGENILMKDFSFDIELILGKGSYICGEETALLNSIEGKRPEVRSRPPYPTEYGLFGKPTLINNVETLANIPWIISRGSDAYKRLGFSRSRGTKVVSLNSLLNRPGLYEVEFGIPLRRIIQDLGGGLKTGEIRGVIVGGPLAGVIPPSQLDTPLGFEEMRAVGGSVGHGGIVAFDQHTTIPELIHHTFQFAAYESCGKCTPCRLGSREVEQVFGRVLEKRPGTPHDKKLWSENVPALAMTSLCGLGIGLAEFAQSVNKHYGGEVEACLT